MKEKDNNEHHIWCNFFNSPREGCKLCDRLYKDYPMEATAGEMMSKYFPDVIVREKNCEKR